MIRLKNTKVGSLRLPGIQRTEAFELDLEYYLGKGWMKNYTPRYAIQALYFSWSNVNIIRLYCRDSVVKYLIRLRQLEDADPNQLMAYIYHLYMGLLSGGIILRKKRQLMRKFSPFKDVPMGGDCVTDFGDYNVFQLKRDLRNTMNDIADTLDEDTKNKLIEESKNVYALNNEIIRSVRGAGPVVIKKVIYFVSVFVFILFIIFVLFK